MFVTPGLIYDEAVTLLPYVEGILSQFCGGSRLDLKVGAEAFGTRIAKSTRQHVLDNDIIFIHTHNEY